MYKELYNKIETLEIKGVGEKTIVALKNLGINTIMDLIFFFPRTYEDRSCQDKGSSLVQINSQEVQDFINSQFSPKLQE